MTRNLIMAARHLPVVVLASASPVAAQAIDVEGLGFVSGSPDAPVQVVEFSDYACPFCREFHQRTFQILHDAYVATGKVRWVYVNFASGHHPNSRAAAAVAECAVEQGGFEAVRDRLFQQQDDWKDAGPEEAGARFLEYAADAGLDSDRLVDCAESSLIAERIGRASALAARVGVTGTPTYVIDGFPVTGALPAEFIAQVLDARLAQLSGNPS